MQRKWTECTGPYARGEAFVVSVQGALELTFGWKDGRAVAGYLRPFVCVYKQIIRGKKIRKWEGAPASRGKKRLSPGTQPETEPVLKEEEEE